MTTKIKEYELGNTGLRVPILSLGGWLSYGGSVNGSQVNDIIKAAFDAGINFFDTAESYGNGSSELEMGRAIKELGLRRSSLVISTKLFNGVGRKGPNDRGLSRCVSNLRLASPRALNSRGSKHLIEGMNESLERLQMDYVFAHCPDPDVPMLEIVRGFTWLINQGKAFYWGTSNWSAIQIEEAHHVAHAHGLIAPAADQCCYNAFNRKRVEEEYQPLDGGFLTGKYNSGEIPQDSRYATSQQDPWIATLRELLKSDKGKERISKVKKLEVIANELQSDLATLSLAWVMKNPHVKMKVSTLIIGATRISQVEANLKALDLLPKVSDEIYKRIGDVFGIE
ncbi:voltage-gated potassium channel beta-2 subunit [Rhizoctonia solani AG-1 IA]|uniref:Voltage-gated potassium channel beta-2 subunit n=1 Tax=Thanatephorus cucumeris (strain AG1-IA) TaxID=983506 RepID=M0QSU9_THACA|nr:voltage-gated potassium channel beta-2 subunit [Rhizoctonia solani AG-1 IA]